jgi:hypothetical protein
MDKLMLVRVQPWNLKQIFMYDWVKSEVRLIEAEKIIADKNYESLLSCGTGYTDMLYVKAWGMKHPIEMLKWMLELYEELEEYEKCARLKRIMDHPDNQEILNTYEIPSVRQM